MKLRHTLLIGFILTFVALPAVAQDPRARMAETGSISTEQVTGIIQDWSDTQKQAVNQLLQRYGAPDVASEELLVWKNNGEWVETVVHKEEVEHNFPVPHKDFLKQSVYLKVPSDLHDELAAFDGSITVNRTRGTVSATCHEEAMNRLALNIASEIVNGKRSVDDARQFLAKEVQDYQQGKKSDYTQKLLFDPMTANRAADPGSEVRVTGQTS